MAIVSQQNLRNPEIHHKLWNHLAYIANFQLDINYPCEINRA